MWSLKLFRNIATEIPFQCRGGHSASDSRRLQRRPPLALKRKKAAKSWDDFRNKNKNVFVDWKRIRVVAGSGGDGMISALSISRKERAGPDGGNGGCGGHVIFQASKEVSSLNHLKSVELGPNGVHGRSKECFGKDAKHRIVKVPIGTIFRNLEHEILAELSEDRMMFVAAKGGAGGKGNAAFKSSTLQFPEFAECGAKGEEFTFEIELSTMAHVGLIGFPNAGKSTLLRAVSRARPKIAAYPFTTLNPHIGIIEYDDFEQIAVADIPGIIKGAHKNQGLGISFLRHIERCLILLYVIDISQPDPLEQFEILKYELEQYRTGLSERPHKVILNKIDLDTAKENFEKFEESFDIPVLPLSAKCGDNITALLADIRQMYDQHKEARHHRKLS